MNLLICMLFPVTFFVYETLCFQMSSGLCGQLRLIHVLTCTSTLSDQGLRFPLKENQNTRNANRKSQKLSPLEKYRRKGYQGNPFTLTLNMLWANSADNKLMIFFLFYLDKGI